MVSSEKWKLDLARENASEIPSRDLPIIGDRFVHETRRIQTDIKKHQIRPQ